MGTLATSVNARLASADFEVSLRFLRLPSQGSFPGIGYMRDLVPNPTASVSRWSNVTVFERTHLKKTGIRSSTPFFFIMGAKKTPKNPASRAPFQQDALLWFLSQV